MDDSSGFLANLNISWMWNTAADGMDLDLQKCYCACKNKSMRELARAKKYFCGTKTKPKPTKPRKVTRP
jgi:hypothetical protein